MGAGVAPPLTLVTLDRTPFNIITKSVGEAAGAVYSPTVLRLRDEYSTQAASARRPGFLPRRILWLAPAPRRKPMNYLCVDNSNVWIEGMNVGRFPSGRAVAESSEPHRAMEEERRLGYVAWTRARRSLTLSYDPVSPSPFLIEAFSPTELGLQGAPPLAMSGRGSPPG